jgi:hypothetical protein
MPAGALALPGNMIERNFSDTPDGIVGWLSICRYRAAQRAGVAGNTMSSIRDTLHFS